ncbi:hypothetical protein AVEN_39157-1 [Araneus ventricosus]|uniref:Uncharacterized protein n=1 Tax=Araneus ventricosus TaxID=182803 RepID=A0A4Y2VUL3_ARAVE|nr:hypothetical protein AVEN_39157-1 [Araneus ventricosus]
MGIFAPATKRWWARSQASLLLNNVGNYGKEQTATGDYEMVTRSKRDDLKKKSGKMFGIDVEEYLTADDMDLTVFEGVTEEDNTFRLEMQNDDDDTDASQSLSISIFNQFSPYWKFLEAFHPQMMIIFVH